MQRDYKSVPDTIVAYTGPATDEEQDPAEASRQAVEDERDFAAQQYADDYEKNKYRNQSEVALERQRAKEAHLPTVSDKWQELYERNAAVVAAQQAKAKELPLGQWLPQRLLQPARDAKNDDRFHPTAGAVELQAILARYADAGETRESFNRTELLLGGLNIADLVRRGRLIPLQDESPERLGVTVEEFAEALDTLHAKDPARRFTSLVRLLKDLEHLAFTAATDGSPLEAFREEVAKRIKPSPAALGPFVEELAQPFNHHTTPLLLNLLDESASEFEGKAAAGGFEHAVRLAGDATRFSHSQRLTLLRAAATAPVSGDAALCATLLCLVATTTGELQSLASELAVKAVRAKY